MHFVQCSGFLWSSSSNFEASFSNYFIDPYQRDQKCNYFNYKFSSPSLQGLTKSILGKKLSKGKKKTLIISISNGSGNLIINCILNQSLANFVYFWFLLFFTLPKLQIKGRVGNTVNWPLPWRSNWTFVMVGISLDQSWVQY